MQKSISSMTSLLTTTSPSERAGDHECTHGTAAADGSFVGRYFSLEYMRRQILKQPDALFKEIDKEMEKEIATVSHGSYGNANSWSTSKWQCSPT